MAQRSSFDLLVIGADAAGVAAAASAARQGASAAIIATGGETPPDGRAGEPPNFVWRLLDLHLYGLRFDPAPARTSLGADGKDHLSTSDTEVTGAAALDAAIEHLWPAFTAEMKRTGSARVETGATPSPDPYLSANALLDDYFTDEMLKAHLASAFVAPFGLVGDEAGSAHALAFAGAPSSRQVSARALADALLAAAQSAGVEFPNGKLASLARADAKQWKAATDAGRDLRAKAAMASSVMIGESAGLRIDCGGSPLLRRNGAEAIIHIRYDKRPKPPGGNSGPFFTAADRQSLIAARNAMIEGKIEESAPLSFEIDGKDIIARAPFCPARLRENGEDRDWTGQDRQVLGRQAAELIRQRLGGGVGNVREIEVTIGPDVAAGLKRRNFDTPQIPAPAPSLDTIGAAASLALELVRRD
jgi:hypothetical protein